MTVLFTVQRQPSYAQTNELLAGCEPAGMARSGDDVWLTGWCGGVRRAVHVSGLEITPGAVELDDEVRCTGEALVLRLGGREVTLDRRADGLQNLMPEGLVPRGARAVWTGRSLVVARARDAKVVIDRFACRGGKLVDQG